MAVRVPALRVIGPRELWRVLRLEARRTPRGLRAWYAVVLFLILIGAVGAVRSLIPGDKGLGTTPTFEWGLLIVGYVFFAVTTSGLCLASSLGTVFGIDRYRPLEKRHAVLATLCLITAFGIIALDLHYPVRMAFGAVLNPSPSSPMWWMGVVYGIYLCFLLIELWSIFRRHPRIHQVACLLASGMAIIAPTTLGAVFGVLAARPYWAGFLTPLLMVATAILSGTALLGVVFSLVERLHLAGFERAGALALPALRHVLAFALLLVAALVAGQLLMGLSTTDPGLAAATRSLLSGPLAVPFVGIRVVGGLLLPLVILALPAEMARRRVLWAGALSIVGVFADRYAFVAAGQIAPTTATSGVVSAPYAGYAPSPVEISILVGAFGFVALVYTLAERYLDLRESEVHFRFSVPAALTGWAGWLDRRAGGAAPVAEPAAAVELPGPTTEPAAAVELPEPTTEAPEAAVAVPVPVPEPETGVEPGRGVQPEPEAVAVTPDLVAAAPAAAVAVPEPEAAPPEPVLDAAPDVVPAEAALAAAATVALPEPEAVGPVTKETASGQAMAGPESGAATPEPAFEEVPEPEIEAPIGTGPTVPSGAAAEQEDAVGPERAAELQPAPEGPLPDAADGDDR